MLSGSNIEALFTPASTVPTLFIAGAIYVACYFFFSTSRSFVAEIPGPFPARLGSLYMLYKDWQGQRVRTLKKLHDIYGPVVRVGYNEISFNSLSALRTIYGAGSPFERTSFYRPFDVYGRQNLFTFGSTAAHRERKKLVSHIYANQTILSTEVLPMIEEKVAQYVALLDHASGNPVEIFSSLHYFSIDAISTFVYGRHHGGTTALLGTPAHIALLSDILSPERRKLAWFAVHLPSFTKWLYSRPDPFFSIFRSLDLLPMTPPTTYTGIRAHALAASNAYLFEPPPPSPSSPPTVLARLHAQQLLHPSSLTDLDIASECADHLLAGIDTTADTLLFLLWALSLPKNKSKQTRLRDELLAHFPNISSTDTIPSAKILATLPYLNAIIRETLRLYTPLPGTEPRLCPSATVIDGFAIPANTVVGIAPYVLHRDGSAFPSPLTFAPERWLDSDGQLGGGEDANRRFWAFSSGARMCIGIHLAMAEMLVLVAAVYSRYGTRVVEGEENCSPGVTSRFEVFQDEEMERMVEHECWIRFERLDARSD